MLSDSIGWSFLKYSNDITAHFSVSCQGVQIKCFRFVMPRVFWMEFETMRISQTCDGSIREENLFDWEIQILQIINILYFKQVEELAFIIFKSSYKTCTAEQAAFRNVLQNRQHIGMYCRRGSVSECTAEQAGYRNVLQNRQHIWMYCRTGSISECTAEQAAYRNALQNRQHIGLYCRTGSISECTAG